MSINYERVLLLLEVIERTAQHGPTYNDLRGEAGKELNKMMDELKKNAGKVVTPPDGPANSAVANADGSYTRIPPLPIRMANESNEAWDARQAEYLKSLPAKANPENQSTTDPRANERGLGETDAQFKARNEQRVERTHDQRPADETQQTVPRRV